jgi:hypothetical protein
MQRETQAIRDVILRLEPSEDFFLNSSEVQ